MLNLLTNVLAPAAGNLIRWGLVLLLAFATLTFGGTPPWAGAVIILWALGLLLLWLVRAVCAGELEFRPSPLDLPLALFLVLILIQLLLGYPIRLNQGDLAQRLLGAAGSDPGRLPFVPGTLDYQATRWSLLSFLAYAACFFLVIHTLERREHLTRLLMGIVSIAAASGFYGLLEYLSGNHGVLGWKLPGGGRVRGTFVNADHFGAFLSMVLLAGVGLMIALGTRRRHRRSRRRHEGESEDASQAQETIVPMGGPPHERLFQQVLLTFLLGLVGTILVFTMSRGAMLSVLLAGGFVTGILALHGALGRRRLLGLAAFLVTAAFALWIGLGPVLDRFANASVDWSSRLIIYRQAFRIVRDFPILGTGFGTFGIIFPRYQSPPLGFDLHVSHAHNDLLQLAAEGGVVALAIFAWGLWALFREVAIVRMLGVARPWALRRWRAARAAPIAAAALAGWIGYHASRGWHMPLALAAGMSLVALLAVGPSAPPATGEASPAGSEPAAPEAVGGDRRERSAKRRDPFNIGVAIGGLGALVGVLIFSAVDFSLRIPANALLLSILLGAMLQAARVRFHSYGAEDLSPTVVLSLAGRRGRFVLLGGIVLVGWIAWIAVSAVIAESRIAGGSEMLEAASQPPQPRSPRPWVAGTRRSADALSLLESAVSLDAVNPRGHLEVGRAYEGLALRAWNTGLSAAGRLLSGTAQRKEEAGRLMSEALAAFARAAYLDPMDRRVWVEIGWAHGILVQTLADGDAELHRRSSLAAFRRAMALRPQDPYPFQLQADYAFQWAQAMRGTAPHDRILTSDVFQAGVQATRRLVELQPAFLPEALNRILLFTADFPAIQSVLPPQAPDYLFAARLLDSQGLSRLGRQAMETAVGLASDEDRPIFYQYLAEDSLKRGDAVQAVRLLEFVLGLDAQNLDARLMLADALAQQKQDDRALREYQAAVDMARGLAAQAAARPAAHSPSELAVRSRLEIVDEALRERGLLRDDQQRDPLVKALAALAGFHERHGRPNAAIPLWEQAIARAPGDAQVHFGYGESLDSIGAWIPAQGEFRRALELDRRDVALRLRLADKYVQNGLTDQAIALWQEVTRIRPANVEAHLRLAGAFEKLSRRREAETEYEQLLRLEPGNEMARQALTRLRGRSSG